MADSDYILIGAGSDRCGLANKLGADTSKSILIPEAGERISQPVNHSLAAAQMLAARLTGKYKAAPLPPDHPAFAFRSAR